MGNVEVRQKQLVFGETIVAEKKALRGIIEQYESVLVPKRRGGYCIAKLTQSTEVEQVKDQKVFKVSGWRLMSDVDVEKNIGGEWKRWLIFKDSIIGALSKQVKKKKTEEIIITKKNSVFS